MRCFLDDVIIRVSLLFFVLTLFGNGKEGFELGKGF